jgi:uncharacterized membrane protein
MRHLVVMLSFLFSLAGIVVGAAGGAIVGKMIEPGVDQDFVEDVSAALTPGASALFFVFATLAALRSFKGTLDQTTRSAETEGSLRHALQ